MDKKCVKVVIAIWIGTVIFRCAYLYYPANLFLRRDQKWPVFCLCAATNNPDMGMHM